MSSVALMKGGYNLIKFVDDGTRLLKSSATKVAEVKQQGLFGTMFEGLGNTLGFGAKVIAESSSAAQTILKDAATKTAAIDKTKGFLALGGVLALTAKSTADALKHSRTEFLIQTRSGGHMTDRKTNNTLRNVSLATAGIGAVTTAGYISDLAGESLIKSNSASPSGKILTTIGNGSRTIVNTVTGLTAGIGDAIKPGLGKLTGAPLALMLAGLTTHFLVNQIFLKMPQGDSHFNGFGWGGEKYGLVTDRTDPGFLQPIGRDALVQRIENDQIKGGVARSAATSSYWDQKRNVGLF